MDRATREGERHATNVQPNASTDNAEELGKVVDDV
jgi:hypothetical protein